VSFRPNEVDRFRITSFDVDPDGASVVLHYALDDEYHFSERFEFTGGPAHMLPGKVKGFEAAVRLLHLAAGVSYYKTAAPRLIVVETGPLSEAEARLCHDIYDNGMREFAYRNGLPVPRDIEISASQIEAEVEAKSRCVDVMIEPPDPGVAVPVGGGKDSIVVLEALKDLGDVRTMLVSVNPSPAVERIASISGLGLARIIRRIDPLLFELNESGALNGHVPVTAIISLVSVGAGYLYGYDTTAMALESSADAPTRVLGTPAGPTGATLTDVNHQWSKSADFEVQLQQVLRESVHDSIRFLSPLRSFSELEITAAFATLPGYHSAFRSCNRAFRIGAPSDDWCCDCPKCRFVFLALASVVTRREVVEVFGADLLDDETQVEGFSDMLDALRKPFECVGTVDEVAQAFGVLVEDPAWTGAVVVERVRPLVQSLPATDRRPRASPSEVFAQVRRALKARAAVS
jgi:hypothetical protein